MRRFEDWMRKAEVVALAVGALVLLVLYLLSRAR